MTTARTSPPPFRANDLRLLLRIGLASHLRHRDAYNASLRVAESSSIDNFIKLLPDRSPLRTSPLFTSPLVNALSKYVTIAMPWEDKKCRYFKMSTGIPPHALLLGYIRGLKESFDTLMHFNMHALPDKIEAMTERRESGRNGGLSLGEVMKAVEEAPMMSTMSDDVASIKRMIAAGNVVRGTTGGTAGGSVRTETNMQTLRLLREFSHGGNDYRRVPPSWNIPQSGLQSM